jgi:hypothetical protein
MARIAFENLTSASLFLVISTKAEGRVERSGRDLMPRHFRCQISRLRWRSARNDKRSRAPYIQIEDPLPRSLP